MTNVAAIVLAAGRSSRMGAFKPLLPFGDKTVIEYAIAPFLDAGVETVVVVVGPHANEVRQHLRAQPIVFAVNQDPDSEMSASIACGVKALPATAGAVLISPADHPATPADVVATIIEAWRNGARLIIPTWRGRGGHPVLIDLAFREELLALPPQVGLRSLFLAHQAQVLRLEESSPYVVRDLDTWEDYRSLHQDVFGYLPPGQGPPGFG